MGTGSNNQVKGKRDNPPILFFNYFSHFSHFYTELTPGLDLV